MYPRSVRVRAPASIANLGPLFDIAALAVDAGYVVVEVEFLQELGDSLRLECEGPPVLREAIAGILEYLGETLHVRARLVESTIPAGVGLGSSGAIAAAAVTAVNLLLGEPFEKSELVRFAGRAEAVTAGAPHYDNAAASLLGGLVLVLDAERGLVKRLTLPEDVSIAIFVPEGEVISTPSGTSKTEYMRSVLPSTLTLHEHVECMRAALQVATLLDTEPHEALRGVNQGCIVEEARSKLIPGYREAKEAALEAGALAFNIAGAGPALFALTTQDVIDRVVARVRTVLEKHWPGVKVIEAKPDYEGARQA